MKYLLAVVLLMFVTSTMAADKSGKYAVWGAAQKSCFSYNKARKSEKDTYFRYFLMGYLTAYNTQTADTYRISGNNNLNDILLWLDNYCEKQQIHGFDQALLDYIHARYPERYKYPPGTGRHQVSE